MTHTVAYFTDSDGFGGAEQALLHLLRGLDRRCWRPLLFYHAAPGLTPLLEQLDPLGVEAHAVPRMPLGKEGALLAPAFARTLQRLRPAVFHAHLVWPLACKYGLVGAMLARVPAIVATAHLFVDAPYTLATRLQQRLLAVGIGRYIAVAQGVAERFQQTFHLPRAQWRVIHNAVPLAFVEHPGNSHLEAGGHKGNGQPTVLTLARLDKQKGLAYLLEAATFVPEARFLLAGEGPERATLAAQAHALGIEGRVHFLGHRSDVARLLASSDLFVLPSLFEGLPLALLEAMAAAKPVIASAIAGNREVVTHGETGLLVPPADPVALAQAIRQLLTQPRLAQQLARVGQARVQQEFSTEVMVQRVTKVYVELLER